MNFIAHGWIVEVSITHLPIRSNRVLFSTRGTRPSVRSGNSGLGLASHSLSEIRIPQMHRFGRISVFSHVL